MSSEAGRKLDLGIRCGTLLSMAGGTAEPLADQFVGIRDGKVAEVRPWSEELRAEVRERCKDFVDGTSHVAMPGMVNGHTHLPMTMFRGLEDDVPFHRWLFERILPLEARLVTADSVRIGTELAALECIRFGVTTVNDMYFFTGIVASVLDKAGLRGVVGQVFADVPMPEDSELGREKGRLFEELHQRYRGHERIGVGLAPHAPYTCSDETFRNVSELSSRFGASVHVHVSETEHEVNESRLKYGKSPVRRLAELGVLGPRTVAAHCVHLDDADIAEMKRTKTAVIYNPDSNLKLGSGIAPITKYRASGIAVAFGTDGAASNNDLSLFGAMDVGTKLQKLISRDNTAMVASDALCCATLEGARAVGLDTEIGSIEVGKRADLILVNLDYPHLSPLHDVRSALVYAAQGLEVDTVVCQGKILMKRGELTTLDRERILRESRLLAKKVRSAASGLS